MKDGNRLLARHLALAVIVKLLALMLLWWFFIRDVRVHPDPADVAAHIGGVASPANSSLSLSSSPQLQGVRP